MLLLTRMKAYLRRGESLRPDALASAAMRVAAREGRHWLRRRKDAARRTYATHGPAEPIASRLSAMSRLRTLSPERLEACERYLVHEFDLLGSGWLQVRHGMSCVGLEGHRFPPGPCVAADSDGQWLRGRVSRPNLREAQRIWRLVDADYVPLDWQIDFRSGYRWSPVVWYADVRYGDVRGADVKLPWELARTQHLPQLALAYHATGQARWLRAIRNQILDFVATNPPRFGVHWCSTMDVAIRVANWLLAWDLCRSAGGEFDWEFEAVLTRSVLEHAEHIVGNLEWFPAHRGNHYLADVVGLLFAAAYLPRSPQADAWLAFATQEVVSEAAYQFGEDGANFEASTCYHRLSAEALAYGVALLLGLRTEEREALSRYDAEQVTGPPALRPAPLPTYDLSPARPGALVPPCVLERLGRAAEFTLDVTKPSGRVAQIGDNDNGRFVKVAPVFTTDACSTGRASPRPGTVAPSLIEDQLEHRHLVGAIGALVGRPDLVAAGDPEQIDNICILALAGAERDTPTVVEPPSTRAAEVRIGTPAALAAALAEAEAAAGDKARQELSFPGPSLIQGLIMSAYPDFGLYIFRSDRLFLAVRCGSIGQAGFGGHAHHDQLSIELSVDGRDVIADPGSYIYTPLPERRNAYRSVHAHAAPRLPGIEPGRLDVGLFLMRDDPRATCLHFDGAEFLGVHSGFGRRVWRHLRILPDRVVVTDYVDAGDAPVRLDPAGHLTGCHRSVAFSPSYGVIC